MKLSEEWIEEKAIAYFLDDDTAELNFSIQVGLTVYPDKATLLIQ